MITDIYFDISLSIDSIYVHGNLLKQFRTRCMLLCYCAINVLLQCITATVHLLPLSLVNIFCIT